MREVDMTVTGDDGLRLAGTLARPAGPGPHPAAVLLHGSGRLDRDGNTTRLRADTGPALAAALAEAGIATLRYDRRGVGATPGDWRAAGFTDNRRDGAAAVRALAERPEIRSDAVAVVGHSEGAVHAMALGTRPDVAAVVLLAGFARLGEDALRWQAANIVRELPGFVRPVVRAVGRRQLARIKAGSTRVDGKPVNARWVREMLAHDPRPELAAIRVPVLAITGGKDVQVDAADLAEIRRLVPGRAEVHRIDDLTHLLRRDPGAASVRSYPRLLRRPVDPGLLSQVSGWLAAELS
ncbi:alpha/beta hydrolase family protein [Amycolatopsis sp. NPDC049252]|uniref:alpha/beta hydrolase family protein n=1 Tax=Amycolatopsis sp. NPDC049252 TaxID=3363933 RepID=UPI0037210721